MFRLLLFFLICGACFASCAQKNSTKTRYDANAQIQTGAERSDQYLPLLTRGKKVAVFANNTSMVGQTHLVDFLKQSGVDVKVIFGPEHGFRGNAPDGDKVETFTDPKTGIPVISLYGKKNKPSAEELKGIDVMVYDIQDVGARFYTYISSLEYYMEAAIESNIPLVVLDRPNPNGHYVDGPVLEPEFKSFIGMQPVPVVYGMTTGEYAQMILGEGWLSKEAMEAYTKNVLAATYPPGASFFQLHVISCGNYTHNSRYNLPVRPSPNLPEMQSVYWYPSTCFFEGTRFSEGRGTEKAFQYIGHPKMPNNMYAFIPRSTEGAPKPKHKDQTCYGYNLSGTIDEVFNRTAGRIHLSLLIDAYNTFPQKDSFFLSPTGINRHAGNSKLMKQIRDGLSEEQIRKTWEPALSNFKTIRKKYLLYPDFE